MNKYSEANNRRRAYIKVMNWYNVNTYEKIIEHRDFLGP